jgi:hypothetical protein
VADLLQELNERLKALAGDWSKYSVLGTFLLYVVGYLALRFHLTTIGVGTDLAVLDERYLFTGARFLVYLVSSIPNIILLLSPLVLLVWAAGKALPRALVAFVTGVTARALKPTRLVIFGIGFAVVMIQFVMRQCFVFSDLLLTPQLPADPAWLVRLLLDDRLMPLYFSALVAASALSIAILIAVRNVEGPPAFAKGLLTFLAAVQVLLLPINYGVLIVDKVLPRVASLGTQPLAAGSEAWLVWEGKDGVTFLIRQQTRRTLLTLQRSDVNRTEILGFDRIVPLLFGSP